MKRIIAGILALVLCLCAPCALAARSESVRTGLSGVSDAGRSNVELAAASISGIVVPYGEIFSFNDIVGPRSAGYGYLPAPNGRGYEVTGGGVAQCAATLYLALEALDADVEYLDLHNYGADFTQDYVKDGADAIAVDYGAGMDFSFVNYDDSLLIEMYPEDDWLYCSVTLEREELKKRSAGRSGGSGRAPAALASIWIDGDDSLYNNILHAASSVNDTVVPGGALFSFNETVGPRTEAYGYAEAVNGRGAEVVGGGVAQVASAIWLAVKNMDDVAIVEKSTYGSHYNQEYVSSSNDAILTDYSGGTDFSFRNTGDSALMISTYLDGDLLVCEVYRSN